jgi:diguanylate cyclase (GGDEF)-like protein/PAS domain S-box-containing protein/hemerythrin-like metal-binding protein
VKSKKYRQAILNILFAFGIVLLGALLRIWPLHGLGLKLAYITFYPAVMLAAVYGGFVTGLLATFLSMLVVYGWHPDGHTFIQDASDGLGMAVFGINGLMTSMVGEAMRRARTHSIRDAEIAHREKEHAQELAQQAQASVEAIYAAERRFRAYFERSMVGMATTSPEKGWVDVNPALCEMLGYSAAELTCMTWGELTYPDDLALDVTQFNRLLSGDINEYEMDKRFIRRDGEIIDTHLAVRGVRKPDGSVDYLVAMVEDISERKRAELDASHFEAIIQSSEDAIISKSLDGKVTSWNAGAERLFGFSTGEMIGHSMRKLFPKGLQNEEDRLLDCIRKGEKIEPFETVRLRKGGYEVDVSVSLSPVRDSNGLVIGASTIARDISERKRAEAALKEQETQFRMAIETSSDGFLVLDQESRILMANAAYVKLSGYPMGALLTMTIRDVEVQEDPEETRAHIQDIMREGHDQFETLHRTRDGRIWPVEVLVTYLPQSGGRFFCFFKDITERKKSEQHIWHQANFDRLTDLPNRSLFFDRLSKELSQARRSNTHVALLFMDLDGFKPVNDRFGHDAGDVVLRAVAKRWKNCIRETDTLARLGGDEFAVIVGDLAVPDMVAPVAGKLIEALASPISLPNGRECQVGVSVGVSIFPENATELDSLLKVADAAMYESKAQGKNTCCFSTASASTAVDSADWLKLDDAHLTGIAEIDEQHQQLVRLVNQINHWVTHKYDQEEIYHLFEELIDYTIFHFSTEHRLMQAANYPEIEGHDSEHGTLIREMRLFAKKFPNGDESLALQTIKDWLMGHVLHADKPLADYLNAAKLQGTSASNEA